MPSRITRKKRETRARILEAAISLFRKQGFAKTRMQDIADRADVAKGTLFNYYPSKDHLLAAYYDQLAEQVLDYACTLPLVPAETAFKRLVSKAAQLSTQNPLLIDAMVALVLTSDPVKASDDAAERKVLSLYRQILGAGQKAGEFQPDADVEMVLFLLNDIMTSTALIWVASNHSFCLEEVLQKKVTFLLNAIKAKHENKPG